MGSTFDIFEITPDGPLWVEAVTGLREAKERMARLALTFPGEYFIHSQGNVVAQQQARECATSPEHFALPTQVMGQLAVTLSREATMSQGILIADDSDTVRRAVHSYLAEQGLDVCGEAADGEDAIEKARTLRPDLVLLDVAMPRTNGIEVASVLKAMMPSVRIVLFTMYSEAVGRTFSREKLAVDAVIDKAEGVRKLAECLKGLLSTSAETSRN
ncbi:MAG TPA: response regulator transcription factor [Candidatus Acidoferrales bacterium]|nr:response regulator transcription factor [Candidatus Acidoferrales bacterium]